MDYKYIKQLLERYWNCETSLEEEDILRTFFSQEDIPSELCVMPWQKSSAKASAFTSCQ